MKTDNVKLSKALANSLYQRAAENQSYNFKFETPKWGYLVGIAAGPSFPNMVSVQPTKVAKFIEDYQQWNEIHFFIAYTDPKSGRVFFRLTEQCAGEEYARKLAKENKVSLIWDVEQEVWIRV